MGITTYFTCLNAQQLNIIPMLLWAVITFVLLNWFSIFFKQLPFKNIEDW
jgi:hypothetical protein